MIFVYGAIYIAALAIEIMRVILGLLLIVQPEILRYVGIKLQPMHYYCQRIIRGRWEILWGAITIMMMIVLECDSVFRR